MLACGHIASEFGCKKYLGIKGALYQWCGECEGEYKIVRRADTWALLGIPRPSGVLPDEPLF